MTSRRMDDGRKTPGEPALRAIMRRLRQIMARPGDGQQRLNTIVRQVAGLMVAEVCSIYLKRQDGTLELFATEGLKQEAVHQTRMNRGEGLVGRCAELGIPVNVPEAREHPAFSYRPETGEEAYHSLLAVPVVRAGALLGVLVVQNQTPREYSDEDVEVLQTTAMVVAEHLVSGDVAGALAEIGSDRSTARLTGEPMSDGIALGHAFLHQPRVVVSELLAVDPQAEAERLDRAIVALRTAIDRMLESETLSHAGAHRDVLEAYRMFANDRGWHQRMQEAVGEGLTAEAAVERVQNTTRARMLRQRDTFWHQRLRDLDDLSDRLLRILTGNMQAAFQELELPPDTILIARNMGPAELLDYDRSKLRGVALEDASAQSHVAIVAKALGVAAVGQIKGLIERTAAGDPLIVDGETGEIHVRPTNDIISVYTDKVRLRARRQERYRLLRDTPTLTKDGQPVSLHLNAGLMVDMSSLEETGADGIGLFRTELQFMIASTFPRVDKQTEFYRSIIKAAGNKPVTFRVLDIGGDKALPYMKQPVEDNPALGWRAVRLALDRPGLFRTQVRALLRASVGRELRLMIPMVATVAEFTAARALIRREQELAVERKQAGPTRVLVGAMVEVPSILFQLEELLPETDFISVGSNDLLQYLFAADRSNAMVAGRYDPLSMASLRALRLVRRAADKHNVPLTMCGEMGGGTLDAMALIGLGYRSISMAPAAIGPVKTMLLALDAGHISRLIASEIEAGDCGGMRGKLRDYAIRHGIEV